jgi:hypothetical protein
MTKYSEQFHQITDGAFLKKNGIYTSDKLGGILSLSITLPGTKDNQRKTFISQNKKEVFITITLNNLDSLFPDIHQDLKKMLYADFIKGLQDKEEETVEGEEE